MLIIKSDSYQSGVKQKSKGMHDADEHTPKWLNVPGTSFATQFSSVPFSSLCRMALVSMAVVSLQDGLPPTRKHCCIQYQSLVFLIQRINILFIVLGL